MSNLETSRASCPTAAAAVTAVPPTVNSGHGKIGLRVGSTTVTAENVRGTPGVLPGFAATSLSPRCCPNHVGVSVGTAAGVVADTHRPTKSIVLIGAHETTFGPTVGISVVTTAMSVMKKFLVEAEDTHNCVTVIKQGVDNGKLVHKRRSRC